MAEYFDLCQGRPGKNDKTIWTNIGAMFNSKSGNGFTIKLNALPIPNKDGEVWVQAFVHKDKDQDSRGDGRSRDTGQSYANAKNGDAVHDDDIPF